MKIFLIIFLATVSGQLYAQHLKHGTINRENVVRRHNFHIRDRKEPGPTQVGNGNFAYGFDITGMQTLSDKFKTMSQWSWHYMPLPEGVAVEDFKKTYVETHGKMVPYDLPNEEQPALSQWLESNPHRFNLARIGLWLKKKDGSNGNFDSLQKADQFFDLWTAIAVSNFEIDGEPVKVTTVGDPDKDIVAFKIELPLIAAKRLGVFIAFPYVNPDEYGESGNASDWGKPGLHKTSLVLQGKQRALFERRMDSTSYRVSVSWKGNGVVERVSRHCYRFIPSGGAQAEYVFDFAQEQKSDLSSTFAEVRERSIQYWPGFWRSGGVVDLSGSSDQRWKELERRVVLSQYDMKINASGKYPPQETGLVNNSWYGRFHYEMILWHNAHYALWDRWPLLDNSLGVYRDNLDAAKRRAAAQGYDGARFPKCTGPNGREWPHVIHSLLVWQQPHPIFFAELDYRSHPTEATIEKWKDIVEASADFLATYAYYDSSRKQYVLGPPITFVSENNDYFKDQDPAFELGYWRYALRIAQLFRKRQGLPENPLWKKVYQQLAPIPCKDSLYEQWENAKDMWTKLNYEHPALLGIYGLLPGDGVDMAIMKRTLKKAVEVWHFDRVWGWDFPMAAMAAARLGETNLAIDLLLHPSGRNHYDKHGFVGGGNPYPYFPTNGGLLYAIALMTAGWDNDNGVSEPGFPKDGSWVIKWEDLEKAP